MPGVRARRRLGQLRPRTLKARAGRSEANAAAMGHALGLCGRCYKLVGATQVTARRPLHGGDGLCAQLQGPVIVPPWAPRPPTADGLARHYRWLIQLANGKSWTEIAHEAAVATPTVTEGVRDLIRLFPGALELVVLLPLTRALIRRVVGERRDSDDFARRRLDLNRIHHLARAGMAPANIARITVGFSPDQIAELLHEARVDLRAYGIVCDLRNPSKVAVLYLLVQLNEASALLFRQTGRVENLERAQNRFLHLNPRPFAVDPRGHQHDQTQRRVQPNRED